MNLLLRQLILPLLVLCSFVALADGSKDLYPSGVRGSRAVLETEVRTGGVRYHNFYNNGRHFAYAKINEVLAVASSAQGFGNSTIRVYSPSGVEYAPINSTNGRIEGRNGLNNRQAELAGPRLGYDAFEITVEEEGVWTIEFTSPGFSSDIPNFLANENWTQDADDNFIAAWDVSVRNEANTAWLTGRVYANVINLHINGGGMRSGEYAYYGVNYVLTKDGYYYKVDGNGSIGLRFTYFVNNSGLLNQNNAPSYQSSNLGFYAPVHDPNGPDIDNTFVTQKIFYTLPNQDLPSTSTSRYGETWLLNYSITPIISNIQVGSSEDRENYINSKGTVISFETNFSGRYIAIISSKDSTYTFTPRRIVKTAVLGQNTFIWDARDGEGKMIPAGRYDINVSIASIDGEVHFPYFDMEINPNGLKLERLDRNTNVLSPVLLYWDDSYIPLGSMPAEHPNPNVNLSGIPSNVNGHRWGTYSAPIPGYRNNDNLSTGNYSFGNNMAIDTWSYAVQIEESIDKDIIVEIADLEVVSIKADKDSIELNETVNYTITVRNNGPSDVVNGSFEFSLPVGFYIDQAVGMDNDCVTVGAAVISNNTLKVPIDIKTGCEAIFVVTTHANNVPDETYGTVLAEAGIVRPLGFTDPDATSNDMSAPGPKSAREECSPNGCNNIKINTDVFLWEPYNERGQIALLKTVRHLDSNGSGFPEAGEFLEYTFTVRNIGQVNLRNIVITDSMFNPIRMHLLDVAVLRKDEEYAITARYQLTAKDIENRIVINRATVLAQNPRNFDVKDKSGTSFSNDDPTTIVIEPKPLFQLKKSVINEGTGENGQFTVGDMITYRFEIKHEGDIAVEQIELMDSLLFSNLQLLRQEVLKDSTIIFEFNYSINDEDILRGFVENSALAQSIDVKYGNRLTDRSGTAFENDSKTITQLAKPPIANNDSMEVIQGVSRTLPILENDEKGSSDWSNGHIEIIEQPTLGSLTINGLTVTYTQNNNFESGPDYFTYRIYDNSRLYSNIARVDIMIEKTKPIAVDDYYLQEYNSRITIQPTENDYVEHTQLDIESITVISYPLNGTLEYVGNGVFNYKSNKTYSGIDEFTYRIMDMNGNWSDTATVRIEVTGILIPNVITPNGDGLNDTFELIGLYQFESVEFQVFDRFKNLIYQNTNYQNNWQVSSSVRDGTYFYILKMTKAGVKPIIKKGSLLITRSMLN